MSRASKILEVVASLPHKPDSSLAGKVGGASNAIANKASHGIAKGINKATAHVVEDPKRALKYGAAALGAGLLAKAASRRRG